MKEFLKVMKAASDPNRVLILKMLQKKVMCVCEIQAALGTAQSTASKHLKILEEAGLVESSKDGLWVNYNIASGRQNSYAASLIGNLKNWLDDEPQVANLMQNLSKIDRNLIMAKN